MSQYHHDILPVLGLLRPVLGITKPNPSIISEVFPNAHLRNTLKAIRCPTNWLPAKEWPSSERAGTFGQAQGESMSCSIDVTSI
jgi:hypothetical protein